MSMNWFWRRKVKKELRLWSEQVLNRPSPFFNGIAPCPYAVNAMRNDQVKVCFGKLGMLNQIMEEWDDSHKLVILVIKDYNQFPIVEWACNLSNRIYSDSDLVAMDFVPGEGIDTGQPDSEITDWTHVVDEPYAMIFVQRVSELTAASRSLASRGYYQNCTDKFKQYITEREHNHARKEEDHAEEGQRQEDHEEEGHACSAG